MLPVTLVSASSIPTWTLELWPMCWLLDDDEWNLFLLKRLLKTLLNREKTLLTEKFLLSKLLKLFLLFVVLSTLVRLNRLQWVCPLGPDNMLQVLVVLPNPLLVRPLFGPPLGRHRTVVPWQVPPTLLVPVPPRMFSILQQLSPLVTPLSLHNDPRKM